MTEAEAYYEQNHHREDRDMQGDQPDTEGWNWEDWEWYEPMAEWDIRCWEEDNQAWHPKFSIESNTISELTDWIEKKIECSLDWERYILKREKKRST